MNMYKKLAAGAWCFRATGVALSTSHCRRKCTTWRGSPISMTLIFDAAEKIIMPSAQCNVLKYPMMPTSTFLMNLNTSNEQIDAHHPWTNQITLLLLDTSITEEEGESHRR